MQKTLLPFIILLFLTLTSCGSSHFVVSSYNQPPIQWVDVYDFNQIHWLYTNHPGFIWTNYWNHPFFIQYRTDCWRRGIYIQPYRETRRHIVNRSPVRTQTRYNSGRSNYNYTNQRVHQSRNAGTTTFRGNTSSRQPNNRSNTVRSSSTRVNTTSPMSRTTTPRSVSRRSGGRVNQ